MKTIIEFVTNHFETIVSTAITILGFIVTYLMTKKSLKDEIKKDKINRTSETLQMLPYDICQLLSSIINNHSNLPIEKYNEILSKVISYGSKDTVGIAIKMQQLSYSLADEKKPEDEKFRLMAAYALLITQLKYDITSEIISPESWFEMRIKDYEKLRPQMKKWINDLISELKLNKQFRV